MKGAPHLKQQKLDHFFKLTDRVSTPTKSVDTVQRGGLVPLPTDNSSAPSQDESDSELPRRRRVRRKPNPTLDEDDSDNENDRDFSRRDTQSSDHDIDVDHGEAPLRRARRLVHRHMKEEEPDSQITEDLNFLHENDIYKERTRGKRVSQFSRALEKLKDRKGRMDSYTGSLGPIDHYHTNPAGTGWVHEDSAEDEDEEDMEDFVVDDDVIDGARVSGTASMAIVELPAEFSSDRMQPLSYNFKIYVEYLVYRCQTPNDKERPSTYFQTAIEAVESRVEGYMHSLLTSDAWLPRYKEALDKHPVWRDLRQGTFSEQCEGCRSNRPSSSKIALTGWSARDEGRDDGTEEDDAGEAIFCLGSECRWRGKVYHELAHFRTHMQDEVQTETQHVKEALTGLVHGEEGPFLIEDILQRLLMTGVIDKLYDGVLELFRAAEGKYVSEYKNHF